MVTREEIGPAELRHSDAPAFKGKLQLDNSIDVERALLLVFRCHNQRGAAACSKAKERLDETAVMERVGGEVPEHAETIDDNALRIRTVQRFRYLLADWLAFHFKRRKDVV